MLYSHGPILTAGADPVLRNVVERTSVLRSGLLVHQSGNRKLYRMSLKLTGQRPAEPAKNFGMRGGAVLTAVVSTNPRHERSRSAQRKITECRNRQWLFSAEGSQV
jgi:hypothetical protein